MFKSQYFYWSRFIFWNIKTTGNILINEVFLNMWHLYQVMLIEFWLELHFNKITVLWFIFLSVITFQHYLPCILKLRRRWKNYVQPTPTIFLTWSSGALFRLEKIPKIFSNQIWRWRHNRTFEGYVVHNFSHIGKIY